MRWTCYRFRRNSPGAALLLPRVLRTQPLPDSGYLSAVTASPAGSGETALPQGVTGARPGEAAEATPAPPPPGPAAELAYGYSQRCANDELNLDSH